MNTSDTIAAVASALSAAQGAFAAAKKDQTNPHFRSKYADLTSHVEAIRAAFLLHGLSVVQDVTSSEAGVAVTTRILHKSGEWLECGPLVVPVSKQDAQGVGSAVSYARRYGLSAAVGTIADDDDGNAATSSAPKALEPPTEAVDARSAERAWDDLYAAADEGTAALKGAYEALSRPLREWVTKAKRQEWSDLRS